MGRRGVGHSRRFREQAGERMLLRIGAGDDDFGCGPGNSANAALMAGKTAPTRRPPEPDYRPA